MRNLSAAKSFRQCFICREWSWDVCRTPAWGRSELCLRCYVDVLEVRQSRHEARGVMGEPAEIKGPDDEKAPGNSPSPYRQLDFFEGVPVRRG